MSRELGEPSQSSAASFTAEYSDKGEEAADAIPSEDTSGDQEVAAQMPKKKKRYPIAILRDTNEIAKYNANVFLGKLQAMFPKMGLTERSIIQLGKLELDVEEALETHYFKFIFSSSDPAVKFRGHAATLKSVVEGRDDVAPVFQNATERKGKDTPIWLRNLVPVMLDNFESSEQSLRDIMEDAVEWAEQPSPKWEAEWQAEKETLTQAAETEAKERQASKNRMQASLTLTYQQNPGQAEGGPEGSQLGSSAQGATSVQSGSGGAGYSSDVDDGSLASQFSSTLAVDLRERTPLKLNDMVGEESGTMEFKAIFTDSGVIAEATAAFLNQEQGGVVDIGVEEVFKDGTTTQGKVIGVSRPRSSSDEEKEEKKKNKKDGDKDWLAAKTRQELKKIRGPPLKPRVDFEVLTVYDEAAEKPAKRNNEELFVVRITIRPDAKLLYPRWSVTRKPGKIEVYPIRDYLSVDARSPAYVENMVEKWLTTSNATMVTIHTHASEEAASYLKKLQEQTKKNASNQAQVDAKAKEMKEKESRKQAEGRKKSS